MCGHVKLLYSHQLCISIETKSSLPTPLPAWLHNTHPFLNRGARHAVARDYFLDLRSRIGQQGLHLPDLFVAQFGLAPCATRPLARAP